MACGQHHLTKLVQKNLKFFSTDLPHISIYQFLISISTDFRLFFPTTRTCPSVILMTPSTWVCLVTWLLG